MRLSLAVCAILVVRWCGPSNSLDQAERCLRTGRYPDALRSFADLTHDKDPKVRLRALVGAGRAAERLRDVTSARRYFMRAAAEPEIAGQSEEAYFEYARRLDRDGDAARALPFYLAAVAGADKNRARAFPYQLALESAARLRPVPPPPPLNPPPAGRQ